MDGFEFANLGLKLKPLYLLAVRGPVGTPAPDGG
jgi:hypothetical protein